MDFIRNKISIDLMAPAEPAVIHAVQGEQYARSVQISILCGGIPWQIPEGTLAAVRYGSVLQTCGYYDTLPDGSDAYSYDGNTITIILAPQMMRTAGTVMTQVELCHGNQILATFSFKLQIAVNPAGGILEPETYINWLQWMENQLEEQIKQLIQSGEIGGLEGIPAEVSDVEVVYQAGISAVEMPTGSWSSTIPKVPAGQYLWTRTTIVFNQVSPVTFYSVTRMGIDGMGSVSSVANISPDQNGNVLLEADHIGALPITGGEMAGPIHMNGQKLAGLNTPEEDAEAATKGYTLGLVKRAAPRNLLDNSDFRNPVNQRNVTEYTGNGSAVYGSLDRWLLYGAGTTFGLSASRLHASNDGSATCGIAQRLSSDVIRNGKTYTLACKGEVTGSCYLSYGIGATAVTASSEVLKTGELVHIFSFTAGESSDGVYTIRIRSAARAATISLEWMALYEGEYTTETLPEYQPKGYAAEQLECMRYFRRINANSVVAYPGHITGVTRASFAVGFAPFRTIPTASMSDDFKITIRLGTGGYSSIANASGKIPSDIVGTYLVGSVVTVCFELGESPGINNTAVTYTIASGYLDLSADL